MSRQVDERVVSMQFDNKHFESNVQTSMSTLDKLKAKLNFKGIGKGLDNVSSAIKKVDVTGLAKGVESVSVKFSALQVAGVTALANITNSAVNAGKSLAKSLSIDQLTAGWTKYADKTASVQTIMNATGKGIDEVNGYLEKLMWFSDETSYGFNDMLRGLATMVSSGGDIDKLIPLITGVGNATAFAGKGAAEFSRVLQYGVNQAYSLGYMQVQDWKTIEGATVNSKQLTQTLIDAGEALGKIKKGEVTLQNFRSSLADKWLDKDVMEVGFGKFAEFSEAVNRLVNGDLDGFSDEVKEAYNAGKIKQASDAMELLEDCYDNIAVKAFQSAQEAKTFQEAIDATKDAVSSGWMRTFEIIFGTYDKAKQIWTDFAGWLWDIFAAGGEDRNSWLEAVMSFDPWEKLMQKLDASGLGTIKKYVDGMSNMTKTLEYYQEVMTSVWRGDYKNAPDRYGLLEAAGHDYRVIQDLVNLSDQYYKGAGYKYQLTLDDVQNSQRKFGVAVTESTEDVKEMTFAISELTDEQLKQAGMTDDEIALFRDLAKAAEKAGVPISELIDKMSKKDGRTLLFEAIGRLGQQVLTTINLVKESFSEIFPPMGAAQLYVLIDRFNELTKKFEITDEVADKLRRTFKGVFAAVDIVATIIGGPIKIAFKLLGTFINSCGGSILDFAANIGDAIVRFRDWIDSILDIEAIFNKLKPIVEDVGKAISDFLTSEFKELYPYAVKIVKIIGKLFSILTGSKFVSVGGNIIEGLIKGLGGAIGKLYTFVKNIAKGIIDWFCDVLGIHSPSLVFFAIGTFIIAGLALGLSSKSPTIQHAMSRIVTIIKNVLMGIPAFISSMISTIFSFINAINLGKIFGTLVKEIAGFINLLKTNFLSALGFSKGDFSVWVADITGKIIDVLGKIPFGDIFAGFITGGMTASLYQFSKGFRALMAPLDGVGSFLENLGKGLKKTLKGLGKTLSGLGNAFNAIAAKKLAESLLILVAAVAVLAVVGSKYDLTSAIDTLLQLTVILLGLSAVASKLGKLPNLSGFTVTIIAMAGAMLLLALSVRLLMGPSSSNLDEAMARFVIMVGIVTLMGAVLAAVNKNGPFAKDAGSMLLKISFAMFVLVHVIKQIGKLDGETLLKGVLVLSALTVFILLLGNTGRTASKEGKYTADVGNMLLKIATALVTMVAVIKAIDSLDGKAITKGIVVIGALGVFIWWMSKLSTKGKDSADKFGAMILQFSIAMLLLAFAMKVVGSLSIGEMGKGIAAIAAFGLLLTLLTSVVKSKGKYVWQVGTVLIAFSVAIGILVAVMYLLKFLDMESIKRGLTAIAGIGLIFAAMVALSNYAGKAGNTTGALVALTAAVVLMVIIAYQLYKLNDPQGMMVAAGCLAAIVVIFESLMFATQFLKTGEKAWKRSIAILGTLAGVVVALGLMIYLLSTLEDPTSVIASATALGGLLLALVGAIQILGNAKSINDKKLVQIAKTLGVIAALVVVCGLIIWALSYIPNPDAALKSAAAVSLLIAAMAGVLYVLTIIKIPPKGGIVKSVGALAAMIVPLALFTAALAFMPAVSPNAENTLKTLLPVLTAMTLLLVPLTVLGTFTGWYGLVGVLALTAMVVPLAAFAASLAYMPAVSPNAENTLRVLLPVMTAMTLLLFPLSGIGLIIGATYGLAALGIVALAAMVGPLWAFAGSLAALPAVSEHAEHTLKVLIPVMTYMTALLFPLSVIGLMAPLAMIGVAALSVFIVGMTGLLLALGGLFSISKSIEKALDKGIEILIKIAGGLGEAIGAFISGLAAGLLKMLPAIALNLSAFMVGLQPFLVLVGAVDDKVRQGAVVLLKAITAFVVAELLAVVGNVLGLNLVAFGVKMSLFMVAAMPFLHGLSAITPEMATAAENLAKLILALTVADVLQGIKDLLNIEGGIDTFGTKLAGFGESMKQFFDSISDFTEDDLKKVDLAATAGKKMSDMIKNLPKSGGWAQTILGETNLETFSAGLVTYGEAMVAFGTSIRTLEDTDVDKIDKIAETGKSLAELESSLPEKGGWAGTILGEQDLHAFGQSLVVFGEEMVKFVGVIRGDAITEDDLTKIEGLADVSAKLNEVQDSLPKQGGWWQDIAGSKNIGEFGTNLVDFGNGIKSFLDSIKDVKGGEDGEHTKKIEGIKPLVKAIKDDVADPIVKAIGSYGDVSSFGKGLVSLAQGIKDIIAAAEGIEGGEDGKDTKTIQALGDLVDTMKKEIAGLVDDSAKTNVENALEFFALIDDLIYNIHNAVVNSELITDEGIKKFDKIQAALDKMSEIALNTSLSATGSYTFGIALTRFEKLSTLISDMTLKNFSGVDKLTGAIKKLAEVDASKFNETWTKIGDISYDAFIESFSKAGEAAQTEGEKIVDGITAGFESGTIALNTAINNALTTVSTFVTEFYSLGCELIAGLAKGISDSQSAATTAAQNVADAVEEIIRAAWQVNSPSKLFYKIALGVGEGMQNAFGDSVSGVKRSADELANSAVSGFSDTVSMISEAINSDIDATPTIRPVFDLTDLKSGAATINGMLDGNRTLSIDTATIGSLSASMSKLQNGNNSAELLSAIRGLRKDVANNPRNSYSINGITVEEGSDTAEAIGALVRAIKVEGRS